MSNFQRVFSIIIVLFLSKVNFSQDQFMIGVSGPLVKDSMPDYPAGIPTDPVVDGYNTSQFNVLSEDGFNIITRYLPDNYTSLEEMEGLLKLCGNNGLQIMTGTKDWYKADSTDWYWSPIEEGGVIVGFAKTALGNDGSNHYNSPFYDHANYDDFFDNLYGNPEYVDIIWGHQLVEESALYNLRYYTWLPPFGSYDGPNALETEVPLIFLDSAITHFNDKRIAIGAPHQELIVWEANHYGAITENLIYDHESNDLTTDHTPMHVIENLPYNTVFFDGSYFHLNFDNPDEEMWHESKYDSIFSPGPKARHYLASFKTIEYANSHVKSVHVVIDAPRGANGKEVYHSTNKPNANWTWFQAYTSIIHGAQGVWFYGMGSMWGDTKPPGWSDLEDRFARENFPDMYQLYISHLSRELRYLANLDLLGDNASNIYTKTDHVDIHCILPPAKDYIPKYSDLPAHVKDLIEWEGIDPPAIVWNSEFRNDDNPERYGLRYTIRSNGDDVIMIISNPLNIDVTNVKLDFSTISNDIIRNCDGVNFLFNDGMPIGSPAYKVSRDSDIDLDAGTVGDIVWKPIGVDRTLTLDFGPMDVHVLEFHDVGLPDYNNGWEQVWDNHGSSIIGDWGDINDQDFFYAGDFNADGEEELLIVQTLDDPGYTWMTMLKYDNVGQWEVLWSNSGGPHAMAPYRKYLQVGNFDGGLGDELLANDPSGLTATFKYVSGDWTMIWHDGGAHPTTPYKDIFTVGDFNGDGKDEILGWDADGSDWVTMFGYDGLDWIALDSDFGIYDSLHDYRWQMLAMDVDGDGKDEIIGFNNPPDPAPDGDAEVLTYIGGDWYEIWSTAGGASFGGWTYPIPKSDRVLIGDLDNIDGKDEIMFIQTTPPAKWATTLDFKNNYMGWNYNWSANPGSVSYIDDWPLEVSSATSSKYFLIKPDSNKPSFLMALRKFGCETGYKFDVRMYKSQLGTNKSQDYDDSIIPMETEIYEPAPFDSSNVYNLGVFPNPNKGEFNIRFMLTESDAVTLELFDTAGRLLRTIDLGNISKGRFEKKVSFNNLTNGIYILHLVGSNGSSKTRISITK